MKHILMVLAMAASLAGCSSGVKLDSDSVPVEDKAGNAVSAEQANGSATGKSSVAPVDLSQSGQDKAGPAGIARVVYFDFDSFAVKPEFQGVLEAHARFLKAERGRKVALEGHTDERGGREYNLALGQKRAEAVRRALALLGVSDGQLEAVSFGKEKPAAPGHDEASMAQNRRVEFSYH